MRQRRLTRHRPAPLLSCLIAAAVATLAGLAPAAAEDRPTSLVLAEAGYVIPGGDLDEDFALPGNWRREVSANIGLGAAMNRLLAAPMRRSSVVLGKAITSFAIGVMSMTTVILVTSLALGAEWGDPIGVAILVLSGVIAALGLMMMVAAFARTAEQAGNFGEAARVAVNLAEAGGFVEALSKIAPHAWFLRGLGDLAGGSGLVDILPSVWPILLFAVITGGLASIRLRKVVAL